MLGARIVDKISRAHIARLHHDLQKTPVAANRVLAVLTTLFNLAEKWGFRPDGSNPCRHVPKYKEHNRKRYLNETELIRLGEVLTNAEQNKTHSPSVLAAIKLLIFLGARRSEVLTLKWEYVDLDTKSLRLPDSKTGSKTIHLNAPALAVLDSLPGIKGNPYVLPGNRRGAHLVNLQTAWQEIRKDAGLEDVRLHDLRHSFASVGAGAGMSLPTIGALLGHRDTSTTNRYAHLDQDPLKKANEEIGGRLHAALAGRQKKIIASSLKPKARIKRETNSS